MASAMASMASRNVHPPYTIPVGPRVRPPRLLPGTKAANTDPQPDEKPPNSRDVWVQGEWRNANSNAARNVRETQSTQVEKALRHATHGMNIYAYSHIRTNQVVYSLTRVMQNNKILSQLLFHGKQTVPASLRRDVWRPYFSIHFSQTPAGAEAGLKAYRRLRELSMIRQLSPDPEYLIATPEDVKKARAKYTPEILERKLKDDSIKNMPVENQLLPKKLRAKKLMNQKATSVADAAWVLEHLNTQSVDVESSPAEILDAIVAKRISKHEDWSSRALRRLDKIKQKEDVKKAQIGARQQMTEPKQGQLGFTLHASRRIALEHSGTVAVPQKGMEYGVKNLLALENQKEETSEYEKSVDGPERALLEDQAPADFNTQESRSQGIETRREINGGSVTNSRATFAQEQKARNDASKLVQILWADMRDGTWAENWPDHVRHGELESRAVVKHEKTVRQKATIDEQGNEIPNQLKKVGVQSSSTPHVFGNGNLSGWYKNPDEMNKAHQERRAAELTEWKELKTKAIRKILESLGTLSQQQRKLTNKKAKLQPEFDALQQVEATGGSSLFGQRLESAAVDSTIQNLTQAERDTVKRSMVAVEDQIATNKEKLLTLETNFSSIFPALIKLVELKRDQVLYADLLRSKSEIAKLKEADRQEPAVSKRLQQIDSTLSIYEDEQRTPSLHQIKGLEVDLRARTAQSLKKIASWQRKITHLEKLGSSPGVQTRLEETRPLLQNEQVLLSRDIEHTFITRESLVDEAIRCVTDRDNKGYEDRVIALLNQRHDLNREHKESGVEENDGKSQLLKEIDEELRLIEDNQIREMFGFEATEAPKLETDVQEYNEEMRAKGIEAPKPASKSIFGRIKALFGR